MFFVLDPSGHVYISGATLSGDALDRAVHKFRPDAYWRHRSTRRAIWLEMKEMGYSIIERQLDAPQGAG